MARFLDARRLPKVMTRYRSLRNIHLSKLSDEYAKACTRKDDNYIATTLTFYQY